MNASAAAPFVALPKWDSVFSDPSVFDTLPVQAQDQLYEQVVAMEARLRARMLRRRQREGSPSAPADRAVRIEEALELLGMSKDYLYRHWKKLSELGGYRDVDNHVKFPMAAIQRYIERRARR